MRRELLYNPLLLMERVGTWAVETRRIRRLRGTPAEGLTKDHIDALELLDLVRLRAGPPYVVYDVGANVGTWTLLAKSLFPSAEIHAFEPLEQHSSRFREATGGLSNVHLHSVALGARAHEAMLHVTDFSDASSILPLAPLGSEQWQIKQTCGVPIQVVALDQWIAANELPPPDLLKLDVQGYELAALSGAAAALTGASAVIVEVSFEKFYVDQCLAHEVSALLAEAGFRLVSFGATTPVGKPLVQADALYMKV